MNADRKTRKTIPGDLADTSAWRMVDVTVLSDDQKERFAKLKLAIEEYLAWKPISPILSRLRLNREQLLRALNRCISVAEDGRLQGWRGLLPHVRINSYERTAPILAREGITRGGYAGALSALFKKNREIQEEIDNFLVTRRRANSLPEARVSMSSVHGYFIDLCQKAKITHPSWPFCVERLGKGAIASYARQFFNQNYDRVVLAQYGAKAEAKSKTGTGYTSRLLSTLPFDVVELDEHKAHFVGSIGINTAQGLRWFPIRRVTIILLVDRVSGLVLGYTVVFRREARDEDILSAIAKALRAWEPRTLAPGLKYPEGSGFPSSAGDSYARCGWCMLLVDNALVHMTHSLMGRVRRMVGCAVNFGPVRRFERRPLVERVFNQLSRAGFHRVSSTTGSNNQDPLRADPEAAAVKHKMSAEAVLDLIEMVIADYNGKMGKANFGISGLEYLRGLAADPSHGFLPPQLPPPSMLEPELDVVVELGPIRGSQAKGERPYISLEEVSYTSPELARRWDLIGQTVRRHIRPDNILDFDVFLEDGTPLGTVHALGRWSKTPHSRDTRRQILAAIHSGELTITKNDDPVVQWLAYLSKAVVTKSGRSNKVSAEASQLAEAERQTRAGVEIHIVGLEEARTDSSSARAASDVALERGLDLSTDVIAIN